MEENRNTEGEYMELGVKGMDESEVVGTIREDGGDEHSSSSASSIEFTSDEQFPDGKSWSLPNGHEPDVLIHVQNSRFLVHKEALIARSSYLKQQLSEFPEITLSPPLSITPQTFSWVADFCYGIHVALTPFNVAALRTAAELLGMTEISGPEDENLQQMTESYFRRDVADNRECVSIVLESCFSLLPEAETAASLVSRCIEALSLTDEADSDGNMRCLEKVKSVAFADVLVILESVSQRVTHSHDILYIIIDFYLWENIGTVTEEQIFQMCHYINCSILSPKVLMHAVQNPRMPVRFVIQAMFVEQLNTRRSIFKSHHKEDEKEDSIDAAGAVIQQDAALLQASQIKAIMSSTDSRIRTLEKELGVIRKLLSETVSMDNRINARRSATSRFTSPRNKIERGQEVTCVSSLVNCRGFDEKVEAREVEKSLGYRLMGGLKSVFRQKHKKHDHNKWEKTENRDAKEDA